LSYVVALVGVALVGVVVALVGVVVALAIVVVVALVRQSWRSSA
jgi:hypothetical protein